jgi:hypothetical protein
MSTSDTGGTRHLIRVVEHGTCTCREVWYETYYGEMRAASCEAVRAVRHHHKSFVDTCSRYADINTALKQQPP